MTKAQRQTLGRFLLAAAAVVGFATLLGGGGAMVIGLVITWLVAALYTRPGAREHANLPDLSGERAFPVTMVVWQNRRRVGRENGWVAFVDGWIVYEGLRTSFSVRASDVQSMLSPSGAINLWFPSMGTARLSLLTDYMQTSRPAKLGSRAEMNDAYNKWRGEAIPDGRPIFPPIGYSPRVLGERTAENFIGGLILVLISFLFSVPGFYLGVIVTWFGAAICFLNSVRTFRRLKSVLRHSVRPSGLSAEAADMSALFPRDQSA